MQILSTPQGDFKLARFPFKNKETLRAWDAADEYLLKQVSETTLVATPRVLILNDHFGALTVALAAYQPTVVTDSYLSHQGILQNLSRNDGVLDNPILDSVTPLSGHYDLVLVKVPKTLALLEDQLIRLKPHISSKTVVIGAGMARHIHKSTLALFSRIIGETKTSLAVKKARLIFSQVDTHIPSMVSPYPSSYLLEGTDYTVLNHANVFSRDSLDIGTRVLLKHLPTGVEGEVIDLGCGNGIVGLMLAAQNPMAELRFVDESYMAVASAKANFINAFGRDRQAQFEVTDCLQGVAQASAQLIINNPPFHQQHVVGDHIAWQMFKQSFHVLKPGGELWVIGNRHLQYGAKLKRLFGNSDVVAADRKFTIFKALKK